MTRKRSTTQSGSASLKKSPKKDRYRSPTLRSVHKTAEGLYVAGLMSKKTMKHFDEGCLTPVKPLTASEITAIREREDVSQSVFARYLGLSITTISQWERGEKKPQGASLKLLTLVAKNGLDFVA
jgi:putative transcriptional regulator